MSTLQPWIAHEQTKLAARSPFLTTGTTFDPWQVYKRLLDALREVLNCTGAAVLMPIGAEGFVPAQFGPQVLPPEVHLDEAAVQLIAHMEHMRQPLLQLHDQPFAPPLPTPGSDVAWMGVPLLEDHACLSIVGVFRAGDERLAFALAQQASLALLWGQRYAVAQRQVSQAQSLMTIGRQLQHAHEWMTVLDIILDVVIKATSATHGSLFAIKNEQATILARRGYSMTEDSILQQIPPSLKRGLLARAYQTRKPVCSDDVLLDTDAIPVLAGTRSQAVIPVCSAGQILGLIDLQSPHPHAFCTADDDWLQTIGALAAVPIDRWRCQQLEQQGGVGEIMPQQQLLLSAHLAAVNDLAAGVAHEINNPLTTILGYAHLLLREPALPQELSGDLRQIVVEGQRIETLVKRFLRFAQPTSSIMQPVAVCEPLQEALEFIRSPLQGNGVQLHLEVPSESPVVLGQPGQIVQVFLELVLNAIEAMSTVDKRHIAIHVSQRNGWVLIAITDTGCGIMPEYLTRVFEPGFTTKIDQGVSRGIGLGLYAAHTIVQTHRGWIDVTSKLGQGSTFTVCLPVV